MPSTRLAQAVIVSTDTAVMHIVTEPVSLVRAQVVKVYVSPSLTIRIQKTIVVFARSVMVVRVVLLLAETSTMVKIPSMSVDRFILVVPKRTVSGL